MLLIDFRLSRKSAELGEWLDAPHPMRLVGSMYAPGNEQSSFSPITIGKNLTACSSSTQRIARARIHRLKTSTVPEK
jgi:hypothetical protein